MIRTDYHHSLTYNFLYWIRTVETLDLTYIKSTHNWVSKYSHKPLFGWLRGTVGRTSWYVWPTWAILLVFWQSIKTRMTDNRGDLEGQRSRSYAHIVCTSHPFLFLIRETKCCTYVMRGGRGHTVSARRVNPTATLLV